MRPSSHRLRLCSVLLPATTTTTSTSTTTTTTAAATRPLGVTLLVVLSVAFQPADLLLRSVWPVYRRHLSSLPYQVLYSTLSRLRTAVSTSPTHHSTPCLPTHLACARPTQDAYFARADSVHHTLHHSPAFWLRGSLGEQLSVFLLLLHNSLCCFSPRPCGIPDARPVWPRSARYTLIRIVTNLILPKTTVLAVAYSGTTPRFPRTRPRSLDCTVYDSPYVLPSSKLLSVSFGTFPQRISVHLLPMHRLGCT